MTSDRARKKAVRERMAATGEPYSVAARQLTASAGATSDSVDVVDQVDVDPAATDPGWWPTREHAIAALEARSNRNEVHPHWRRVLGRLQRHAERHTALRNARELLAREREALAGPTRHDPTLTRPSASLAVFDAIGSVGELETEELLRYAYLAQAALELVAAGQQPASWWESIPGEDLRRLPVSNEPIWPEVGVPEALGDGPEVRLIDRAHRDFYSIDQAREAFEREFGCNELCDELEEGCSGGPHIPEHMIDYANELEEEMSVERQEAILAAYADAIAWTLTHQLRGRLLATATPASADA